MSPVTHLMGSWLIAGVATDNLRDRKLVTLAGVIPDADGLGILLDWTRAVFSGQPSTYEFLELFSRKGDAVFVGVLRKWRAALTARFTKP